MRKLQTILTLLVVILFTSSFINAIERTENIVLIEALTPHAPITINDDLDFIGYAFPGAGTSGDPYIITNYSITISSSYGIYIDDVTKYFVISNCHIENQNTGIYIRRASTNRASIINNTCLNSINYGIHIEQSDEVDIINNTCSNNDYGIIVEDSETSEVLNNTCYNNAEDGLSIDMCVTSTIKGNTCFDNEDIGIVITASTLSVAENNLCYGNSQGMRISTSDYIEVLSNENYNNIYESISISNSEQIKVKRNLCFSNGDGISIRDASTSEIMNNTCFDNEMDGIKIEDSIFSTLADNNLTRDSYEIEEDMFGFYLTYTIYNNTVNNLPFGFLTHLYDETILTNYGQFFLVNCSSTVIENKEFVSIKIVESPNSIIKNNIIENGSTGIEIQGSVYTEVTNNSISNQGRYGIKIQNSESSFITNNTIQETEWDGIYVLSSSNTDVINNSIYHTYGCTISSSMNSDIINNSIDFAWYFTISNSDGSKIVDNILNLEYGFQTWSSSSLVIMNNRLYGSSMNLPWQSSILSTYFIENNWVNDFPFGYFYGINDIIISNQYGQLYLLDCERVTVKNQNLREISYGITLNLCDDCTVQDTFLQSDNFVGTSITILNSSSTNIVNITAEDFWDGIFVQNSPYTFITQSKLTNCYIGLEISWGSNNNQITHNQLKNNTRHGIEMSSDNNVIHHNNFIDNRKQDWYGFAQVQDSGSNNIWYDDSVNEGNFWSDWSGIGSYMLDGGSIDPYPLGSEAPINIPEFSTNSWVILICGFFFIVLIPVFRKRLKK